MACLKEFPSIETDIWQNLRDRGVRVVAVDCEPSGNNPGQLIQRMGLTFDFAMDFDGELLRRFRLPGEIFPLNVVLDREHRLVGITRSLEQAQVMLESLADDADGGNPAAAERAAAPR